MVRAAPKTYLLCKHVENIFLENRKTGKAGKQKQRKKNNSKTANAGKSRITGTTWQSGKTEKTGVLGECAVDVHWFITLGAYCNVEKIVVNKLQCLVSTSTREWLGVAYIVPLFVYAFPICKRFSRLSHSSHFQYFHSLYCKSILSVFLFFSFS